MAITKRPSPTKINPTESELDTAAKELRIQEVIHKGGSVAGETTPIVEKVSGRRGRPKKSEEEKLQQKTNRISLDILETHIKAVDDLVDQRNRIIPTTRVTWIREAIAEKLKLNGIILDNIN